MKFLIETKANHDAASWNEVAVVQVLGENDDHMAREDALAFAHTKWFGQIWAGKAPEFFKADFIVNAAAHA